MFDKWSITRMPVAENRFLDRSRLYFCTHTGWNGKTARRFEIYMAQHSTGFKRMPVHTFPGLSFKNITVVLFFLEIRNEAKRFFSSVSVLK